MNEHASMGHSRAFPLRDLRSVGTGHCDVGLAGSGFGWITPGIRLPRFIIIYPSSAQPEKVCSIPHRHGVRHSALTSNTVCGSREHAPGGPGRQLDGGSYAHPYSGACSAGDHRHCLGSLRTPLTLF